ncbi:hypothetical protein JTB14_037313 [Gonioctena quinquepunctata]|nr:hypothetical protein JTB14_037313 [Gonioctena quinquepunctata]
MVAKETSLLTEEQTSPQLCSKKRIRYDYDDNYASELLERLRRVYSDVYKNTESEIRKGEKVQQKDRGTQIQFGRSGILERYGGQTGLAKSCTPELESEEEAEEIGRFHPMMVPNVNVAPDENTSGRVAKKRKLMYTQKVRKNSCSTNQQLSYEGQVVLGGLLTFGAPIRYPT